MCIRDSYGARVDPVVCQNPETYFGTIRAAATRCAETSSLDRLPRCARLARRQGTVVKGSTPYADLARCRIMQHQCVRPGPHARQPRISTRADLQDTSGGRATHDQGAMSRRYVAGAHTPCCLDRDSIANAIVFLVTRAHLH